MPQIETLEDLFNHLAYLETLYRRDTPIRLFNTESFYGKKIKDIVCDDSTLIIIPESSHGE